MAKFSAPAQLNKSGGSGLAELRRRLFFLLIAIVVYRIGSHIPVPGIDPNKLAQFFNSQGKTILGLFNMFSGGALQRLSVLALGVMPYISASIIIQLLTAVVPSLEELKKEGGEAGQRKITQYTRYGTLALALLQSVGITKYIISQGLAIDPGMVFFVSSVVTLVTGTMFIMWLGEQITERGIGNGISMLIFAGIVAGLPSALGRAFTASREGDLPLPILLLVAVAVVAVTAFVVFMERAQRKITVNYAKRQQGRRMFAAQSSHLPLKINMAGVIPPIFASSILLFPATLSQWFGHGPHMGWLSDLGLMLSPGQPLYLLLFCVAVIFFAFFYTALVFNPRDTADNLKKSGAFIPGIRPGEKTARYIDGVMTRLTLVGAIYVAAVSLLPEFFTLAWNVPFYFGGTSLLIVVVVVMDFISQVQAHLMSRQYDSLLKKANLKGR
ncbi:preprotein translocase subunit SecY [Piscirickettsia salmonis]|uniref:Protein translocase subunit SecY n=1 Tax=Piscirickettsia salmonis TaxID=1238 RepID=A0A095BM84_PISSA|nr:preprotein translocase subunit SecY [Piscirickettsia salmonis]RNC79224.1 preprotein translocase subunit SecY [Piscirickettsiaceae bacterium NZ-RLO2]AKP72533.1 preprotein translocase subunit SecY [Piscirickettsia salmonis LF-89 = ATCC VR-1361]ALA23814.1 preprotein translocase subunit SecY [Piscirickettsia salmonis]ALB23997.1 preprotein translocase subunit SecY [Piscirickettsia salmonis]ALY03811.1 preprotein translocase subunit SecY [Piscirickettsia salmonis]